MDHHHPPRGASLACNHLVCGLQHLFGIDKLKFLCSAIVVTLLRSEMTFKDVKKVREVAQAS